MLRFDELFVFPPLFSPTLPSGCFRGGYWQVRAAGSDSRLAFTEPGCSKRPRTQVGYTLAMPLGKRIGAFREASMRLLIRNNQKLDLKGTHDLESGRNPCFMFRSVLDNLTLIFGSEMLSPENEMDRSEFLDVIRREHFT